MISLLIVLLYLLGTGIIGYGINKKNKTKQTTAEMFVANRSLPLLLVVPLLFGELIAGSSTVGAAGTAYKAGLAGGWGNWGHGLGCLLFGFVFLKFFCRVGAAGAMTGPEAFEVRFDRKVRMLILVFTLIPLFIILSTQLTAAAVLLSPLTGISQQAAILLISIYFLIMALLGVKGIAGMNVVHAVVIFLGMIVVAYYSVKYIGGINVLIESVPSGFFNPFSAGLMTVFAQVAGGCLGFSTSVTPINTCYSAKNPGVVLKGMIIVAILAVLFSIFPLLIGMAGAVAVKGAARPDSILFLMSDRISPVLSGIATMAEFAAIFSTAPFFLLSITTLIVRDIIVPFSKKTDERTLLIITRLLTVVVLAVVVMLSGRSTSILNELLSAGQIKASAAILLIVAIHWKRLTNTAAFWGLAAGGTLATVWHFGGRPWGLEPLWPALVSSLTIMILISLTSKEKISKDYIAFEKKVAMAEKR